MNDYIKLAKLAVEKFIKAKEIISVPKDINEELLKKEAGVFVTIRKNDELRGCIGTSLPTKENIAQEIIANAISAVTRDYRFTSITKEDLPDLSYEVSILTKPQLIEDKKKLNPKKFGVIVSNFPLKQRRLSKRTGLLLPDLERVDTIQKQILIACRKAGLSLQNKSLFIYRFQVKKY